jgi:hypothetical protein
MATNPQRSDVEVFVNQIGTITIRQADEPAIEEEPMVVVHPDDVSMLIRALVRAKQQAARAAEEEHEEVTVPALYARWPTGSA